jgi:hypothetical protein
LGSPCDMPVTGSSQAELKSPAGRQLEGFFIPVYILNPANSDNKSTMISIALQARPLARGGSWQPLAQACRHQSSRSGGVLSSTVVQPMAPIFNRREKKKLRNAFPRPDKSPQVLHPTLPPSFVNRVGHFLCTQSHFVHI